MIFERKRVEILPLSFNDWSFKSTNLVTVYTNPFFFQGILDYQKVLIKRFICIYNI